MSQLNIIRAWKDKEYRLNLSDEEHAQLPAHPAGLLELNEDELLGVAGGVLGTCTVNGEICCNDSICICVIEGYFN